MKNKTLTIVGLILLMTIGRDDIVSFIKSFSEGFKSFSNSLPSITILILLGLLIIELGNKKN